MTTTTPFKPAGHNTQRSNRLRGEATSLRVGVAVVWLSIIVLLPLAAIAWQSVGGGWDAFWLAVTSNAALESFRVTLTISAGVTVESGPDRLRGGASVQKESSHPVPCV